MRYVRVLKKKYKFGQSSEFSHMNNVTVYNTCIKSDMLIYNWKIYI